MQYGFVNSHVPYTDATVTMCMHATCMVDYDTKSIILNATMSYILYIDTAFCVLYHS